MVFQKLLVFRGRMSKSEFAKFFKYFFFLNLFIVIVSPLIIFSKNASPATLERIIPYVISLLTFLIDFSLSAAFSRRLHDFGRSAMWPLFFLFAAVFHASMVLFLEKNSSLYLLFISIGQQAYYALFITLTLSSLFKEGDKVSNLYGDGGTAQEIALDGSVVSNKKELIYIVGMSIFALLMFLFFLAAIANSLGGR
jgi:uncharacterized membrane protein YhaH (DUF805 family)